MYTKQHGLGDSSERQWWGASQILYYIWIIYSVDVCFFCSDWYAIPVFPGDVYPCLSTNVTVIIQICLGTSCQFQSLVTCCKTPWAMAQSFIPLFDTPVGRSFKTKFLRGYRGPKKVSKVTVAIIFGGRQTRCEKVWVKGMKKPALTFDDVFSKQPDVPDQCSGK